MTAPYSVILVPPEGDPDGLLVGGPCGFRPPVQGWWACITGGCGEEWWGDLADSLGRPPSCPRCSRRDSVRGKGVALVLGYKGELLDVGLMLIGHMLDAYTRRILAEWMAGDFAIKDLSFDCCVMVIDERGHVVDRGTV